MLLLIFITVSYSIKVLSQEIDPAFDETDDLARYVDDFPVDLNRATRKQLEQCKHLNAVQIDAILDHINTYGGFISVYELLAVPEIETQDIGIMRRYFFVDELPLTTSPPAPAMNRTEGAVLMQGRWRKDRGFQYRGRADVSGRRSYMGIRFERDEGEPWSWKPERHIWGIDHVSFTYEQRFRKNIKSVTVGEYQLHAGMGLVFNAGFFLGKGSAAPLPAATSYIRSAPSFRENEIQSGAAVRWEKSHWKFIGGVTRNVNDAVIYSDGTFRSLSNTGYHSSTSEKAKHNTLIHHGIHGVLQYSWNGGYAGATLNQTSFSHPFHATADYQKVLPTGREFTQTSLFGFHRQGRNAFWIECALGNTGAVSAIGGVSRTFGRHASLIFILRKYSPRYVTFWGKSLSESSNGHRNENGLYVAYTLERRKRYRSFTYIDFYHVPHDSYRHIAGLHGAEFRNSYSFWLNRKNEIRLTTRFEWRSQQPGNPTDGMITYKQQLLAYYALPRGRLMLRLQYNGRKTNKYEDGWLGAIEKRFDLNNVSLSIFLSHFSTSSYYTREFVYERDVWGSFSLPSYFHKGFRALLFFRWRIEKTTLWIRAGLTRTSGKSANGEVKLQVKYQI